MNFYRMVVEYFRQMAGISPATDGIITRRKMRQAVEEKLGCTITAYQFGCFCSICSPLPGRTLNKAQIDKALEATQKCPPQPLRYPTDMVQA